MEGNVNTSWLNDMYTLLCMACGYEWIQPATTGKCPKCHSNRTEVVLSRVNALPRV